MRGVERADSRVADRVGKRHAHRLGEVVEVDVGEAEQVLGVEAPHRGHDEHDGLWTIKILTIVDDGRRVSRTKLDPCSSSSQMYFVLK